MSFRIIAVSIFALAAAMRVGAAEVPRTQQLRDAHQTLARRADQTKGGPRHLLLLEQQRIERMIRDLEHGARVDPAEIDQALERAEHGVP